MYCHHCVKYLQYKNNCDKTSFILFILFSILIFETRNLGGHYAEF